MKMNKTNKRPKTFLDTYQYGASFTYQEKSYQIIGHDVGMAEIECQAIPFDNKYYWFKTFVEDGIEKIKLI